MELAEDVLQFLDLRLAKATHSFTYVLPSTCFAKNSIENLPQGVALPLRKISDSDDKFEEHSQV